MPSSATGVVLNSVRRTSRVLVVRAAELGVGLLSHGSLERSNSGGLWPGDSDGRAEIPRRPIRYGCG